MTDLLGCAHPRTVTRPLPTAAAKAGVGSVGGHTARSRKRAGAAAERLINRELSFLDYDARLLDLARDDTLPLLERVFFLKVSAEMLDEFFMVRVAGLTGQTEAGVSRRLPDGRTPQQTLDEARERVLEIYGSQAELWRNELCPALADERIVVSSVEELDAGRARRARRPLRARDLPGADAARGRARPAVPLHLRAVDQSRPVRGRPRDRRGALRQGQGPGRPAALLPRRPERPLRSARASPLPLPARALPGDGDPRAGAVPRRRATAISRWPTRRTTCSRPSSSSSAARASAR